MKISYDSAKNQKNIEIRGLSFDLVYEFDWASALIAPDERKEYGEARYFALGFIDERLFSLVFTPRGEYVHVISLRKANLREVRRYEKQTER